MTPTADMAQRLRDIARKLREPGLSDEDAEALAREAADLVSKAGAEIEEALRRIAAEESP
jgi:hypothetical protein